jgi:uncharacterized protein with von Willebrand factor type A (vWA) domain
MIRDGTKLPIRLKPEDIEIHRTKNAPKCATVVLLDMSGSMRYDGLYINVKRMGLALDGLILDHVVGGKVRERWEQWDQSLMLQQLGFA